MPIEGIFALIYKAWKESNPDNLPFWDTNFCKDADWSQFLKVPKDGFQDDPEKNDDENNLVSVDPDNHFMRLGNPYMIAVKHDAAAQDAKKRGKPVWVGPKKLDWNDVSKPNRTFPNLQMLNWFTHNSYLEIPMSQYMALYFDSRAEKGVQDSISGIGQMLTGTWGLTGIGGIIGGMMGGPLGAVFGSALGQLGGKALSPVAQTVWNLLGSVIGIGTGFAWNASGKNSLNDDQKRNLPGLMCLLPKDKLELYLKSLFHDSRIARAHARLPYNYFTTADQYPDNLSSVLGKAEISLTFTLSDNITYQKWNSTTGELDPTVYEGRTIDIGQESEDGWIPLVNEKVKIRPGFSSKVETEDPRIKWDGYGYIIEGLNIKCVGKVPYTITFYSPQGYLYGDEKGELKQGQEDYNHPYNKPSYAVWRGYYVSQALYSDDSRLWQNTKNLAKPRYRSPLPFRYPRACLPVPPIDLKYPTWWGGNKIVKVKTNWVHKEVGEIFNSRTIPWPGEEVELQKLLVAYWDIPKRAIQLKDTLPIRIDFKLGDAILPVKVDLRLPSAGIKTTTVESQLDKINNQEWVNEENNGSLLDGVPEHHVEEINVTTGTTISSPVLTDLTLPPLTDSFSKIAPMDNLHYKDNSALNNLNIPFKAPYFITFYTYTQGNFEPWFGRGGERLIGGNNNGGWWFTLPRWQSPETPGEIKDIKVGINIFLARNGIIYVYFVATPSLTVLVNNIWVYLAYQFAVKYNQENNRLELWIETKEGKQGKNVKGEDNSWLYYMKKSLEYNEVKAYGGSRYLVEGNNTKRVQIDNNPEDAIINIPDYLDIETRERPPEKE